MRHLIILLCSLFVCTLLHASPLSKNKTVSQSLGTNIHFTKEAEGEMKLLSQSGLKWIRMDLYWDKIEKQKNHYNFSEYDLLIKTAKKYQLNILFILVYGNPLYDNGLAPTSEEARNAFATWAVTAMEKYKNHPIVWELWNEPNVSHFWRPHANANEYLKLASSLENKIKSTKTDPYLIAPATSRVDLPFLRKVLRAKEAHFWQAISVHPYRWAFSSPETFNKDLNKVRTYINHYVKQDIPILVSEWGYPDNIFGMSEIRQAKYLSRMFLNQISQRIPINIWYDWKNDGNDKKNSEHNFGLVKHDYVKDRKPPFQLKASYRAIKTLTQILGEYRFKKKLSLKETRLYFLEFEKDRTTRYAIWSSSPLQKQIQLPLPEGEYVIYDFLGQTKRTVKSSKRGMTIKLQDAPQYIVPLFQ